MLVSLILCRPVLFWVEMSPLIDSSILEKIGVVGQTGKQPDRKRYGHHSNYVNHANSGD